MENIKNKLKDADVITNGFDIYIDQIWKKHQIKLMHG